MIQKTIQTESHREIHIGVLGKADYDPKQLQDRNNIFENQKKIIRKFTKKENVFTLQQVHGDTFYNTEELSDTKIFEGDALYTKNINEVLVIRTADCMPIFFWSTDGKVIGIIHSGWKGTLAGITEKVLLQIQKQNPNSQIRIFIGPCIRQKNYEVSKEVADLFAKEYKEAIYHENSRTYLSLDKFLTYGLHKYKLSVFIEDSQICTKNDLNYYSHRRGESGRNLNYIYMESI